ncbi:MAG TPA: cytochrome C [Deltaproteobacteria bacterium]|nr:cytochrome C [Deltaproteobacteria bacterium]
MTSILKKLVYKLYVLGLMAFTVWYGTFITPIIFGHEEHEEEIAEIEFDGAGTEEEKAFRKLLAEQRKTAVTDLGYRVVKEQYVKGHFHHVGFTVEPDKSNVCIRCHGDVPHDKAKAIRAFLNMHAFYLACETCHVRPARGEPAWVFRWYDKSTGKPIGNPPGLVATEIDKYGNYGAKIAPGVVEKGIFRFINGEKELAFVEEYIKKKDLLGPTEQSKMKKAFHRRVNEQPLLCDGCHTKKEPYLPFAKVGYPPHRINDLTSTEVVGMVNRYKEFYIPKMLLPGKKKAGKKQRRGVEVEESELEIEVVK